MYQRDDDALAKSHPILFKHLGPPLVPDDPHISPSLEATGRYDQWMIRTQVTVFTAIAVSAETVQRAFLDLVSAAGGFAGFATSVDDYFRSTRQ